MNFRLFISLFLFPFLLFGQTEPIDWVNPYMGNVSHLLVPTYPTIHLPNSFLRAIPTREDYTQDQLKGLPVVTTSHRGQSAFILSPSAGTKSSFKDYIPYEYDLEKIYPNAYSVYLLSEKIHVEFAVSHQSALYEFTYPEGNQPALYLHSSNGKFEKSGNSIFGKQTLQLKDNIETVVYIYLSFEVPYEFQMGSDENGTFHGDLASNNLQLIFPSNTKKLRVKYGISFISPAQAKLNLEREIPAYDLEKLKNYGRKVWNEALSSIEIEDANTENKTVFYTSLYRCFERPVCLSEDNLYFSSFDGKVHKSGLPFYTDDWIWDTYRATHPLRLLIDQQTEQNILHSYLRMAQQMPNKWLPTFPEITGDSRRMNANHGVATLLDAYVKGAGTFDIRFAYSISKAAIEEKTLAPWSAKPAANLNAFYTQNGYVPALKPGEEETFPTVHGWEKRQPVAVTLGTAYDEWCLSEFAKILNEKNDLKRYQEHALNYRNLYNSETGFFHPKDAEGNFIEPLDYRWDGGPGARLYYGENNAWIYRWDVQHNIPDLIRLMGGRESFVANLDQTFREPLGKSKYSFFAQLPDHTGNVGQFSMANEPSLHIPYLYNYAGQPWKTQKRIHSLIDTWFRNDLMGVPGDEDGGGMSAFVVFSMMGFYPVTPGIPMYNIGSPFFEKTTLHLAYNKEFQVIAHDFAADHKYIQRALLNGTEWDQPWFPHSELEKGGVLELWMGPYPNENWGSSVEACPPGGIKEP